MCVASLRSRHQILKKTNAEVPLQHTPVRHVLSTAEAAPGRVGKAGVGERYKEVAHRLVLLIARYHKNGSKLQSLESVREAEELSQRSTNNIVHILIPISFRWSL